MRGNWTSRETREGKGEMKTRHQRANPQPDQSVLIRPEVGLAWSDLLSLPLPGSHLAKPQERGACLDAAM